MSSKLIWILQSQCAFSDDSLPVTRFRTRSQVSLEPGFAVLFPPGPEQSEEIHESTTVAWTPCVSENAAEPQDGNILIESHRIS